MKKNFLYLFTVLCTLSFFTACSDDDDPKDPDVLDVNAAYSGDKLDLKYSDSPLLGKEISFDTKDGKTATITMKGTFDMSIIANLFDTKSTATPSLAPGVIPGEITTTISNVPLTLSGEKYTFEGTDSSNGREIKYSGEVQKDKMTMSVNVTMPSNNLQGVTWKLVQLDMNTGAMPLLFTWKSSTGIDLPGASEPWPTNDMAAMVGLMVSPKLSGVLKDVTFKEDGNIVATYSKAGAAPAWQTSPINLAQYYIKDNKMYLVLNIDMIINAVTKAENNDQFIASIMKLVPQLLPLISNGIPFNYNIDANGKVQMYIDKELLLPILKMVVSDEFLMGYIANMIPENLQGLVGPILGQLPGILETTTEMNIGLNLQK